MKTKPQRGDLVTLRAFNQLKDKSLVPIFAKTPKDVPGSHDFWKVVGNAYSGDIFIFLDDDASTAWEGGGWLIQHPENGLCGWVCGKYFKKVL